VEAQLLAPVKKDCSADTATAPPYPSC